MPQKVGYLWVLVLCLGASCADGSFSFSIRKKASLQFGLPTRFECNSNPTPSPTDIRRLGKNELINTFRVILSERVGGGSMFNTIWNAVQPILATFPEDLLDPLSSSGSNRLTRSHIKALTDIAYVFADESTKDATRTAAFTGCSNPPNLSCAKGFIANFGEIAWRRALSQSEIDSIALTYQTNNDFYDVVYRMLLSPEFFFHLFIRGKVLSQSSTQAVVQLNDEESLSRLTYAVTGEPPKASWRTLVRSSGFNNNKAAIMAALFVEQKAYNRMLLFMEEWLRIDRVEGINLNSSNNPAQTKLLSLSRVSNPRTFPTEAVQEFRNYVSYHLVKNKSFNEMLTNQQSFATSAESQVAAVHFPSSQTPPLWAAGNPPQLESGDRRGIF